MVVDRDTDTVKPRVLALLHQAKMGGCTYVRVTGPLSFCAQRGHPIDWVTYGAARELARRRAGISSYDVYVFPRAADTDGRTLEMFRRLKGAGKSVVVEMDDDYTNEYRHVVDGDAKCLLREATAVTVSTPYLQQRVRQFTDVPVFILPNTINLQFFDRRAEERETPHPTIGLVGTSTHYDDWKVVSGPLHLLAEENPYVHFVVGGFVPDYLEDLPNLHKLPPVDYINYPSMVHQIDIGLAPLVGDDKFNLSKSAIKALEYWSCGAAVIASDMPVYQRVASPDRMILASDEVEWYDALLDLVHHPKRAIKMGLAGRRWVENNRNMETMSARWYGAYEEIYHNRR